MLEAVKAVTTRTRLMLSVDKNIVGWSAVEKSEEHISENERIFQLRYF
jgi:hypothetical protein